MSPLARAIAGLGVTQILGWSSTYYLPATLARPISADLGLPEEVIFGGVSLMLGVGAALSPWLGRTLDAQGGRVVMMAGSALFALGLAVLALAQGLAGYVAAWLLIGAGSAAALSLAASVAVAQLAGQRARTALTIVTLVTGSAALFAFPVTAALEAALGWRGAVAVFACLNLLVCLPLHALVLPRGAPSIIAEPGGIQAPAPSPARRARLFLIMAVALPFGSAVTFGFNLHLVAIVEDRGNSLASAAWIIGLTGPAQVAARLVELLGIMGRRAVATNAVAHALMACGLVLLMAAGNDVTALVAFALLYGFGNGLATVMRAVMPLELFGRAGYGALMGRLNAIMGIANALAPPAFAALARGGPLVPEGAALAMMLASVAGAVLLLRAARR